MSVATASLDALLDIAVQSGCAGVELRNDLAEPLFAGRAAIDVAAQVRERGLSIFAVAQVSAFNRCNGHMLASAEALIEQAANCGAHGICLIPTNDGAIDSRDERLGMLRESLLALLPLLKRADIVGLIEPLGFETASLRLKSEAVELITELDAGDHLKLIHDTFHHHLAGETQFFPEHTAFLHVSGVSNHTTPTAQLTDAHRGLVDDRDRLQNIEQINALVQAGFSGPVSMEAFAPEVHQMSDPATQLAGSNRYIASQLHAFAA
jgi:2-keto-myo-inositol isomerase